TRRARAGKTRPALSTHAAVHRRHGVCRGQDFRSRSLAAEPEHLSRDFLLLQLRRLPGAPHARALAQPGNRQTGTRAYAQRFRRGRRSRPDRGDGELPERRRLDRRTRSAAALYGRPQPLELDFATGSRPQREPPGNHHRKGGRVVDCTGLENRRWVTIRGFESHPFRQIPKPRKGFFGMWRKGCVDEPTWVRQIRPERIWTAEGLARSAQRGG